MIQQCIAVIGAGCSGTLLALHLLRVCPSTTRIILIERQSHLGRGLAYSTENPNHLLNVRAARMSAFEDRPSDFLAWLCRQAEHTGVPTPTGASFASRQLFGSYMGHLLDEALQGSNDRLRLKRANVSKVTSSCAGVKLSLDSGCTIHADVAVLALGNFPPEPPKIDDPSFYDGPFYRPDPWQAEALADLHPEEPLLLIGTGLTMVDVTVSLLDAGHRGPIHAISRRGLLPHRHTEASSHRAPPTISISTSPLALLRLLRHAARAHATHGGQWQDIIDQMRPYTQDVWQTMSPEDRKRFLRHLRPWWDIHRHRMAGPVADRIDAVRANGQLQVVAGRISRFVTQGSGAEVFYAPRNGKKTLASIQARRVINCTGPAGDLNRINDPLVISLLRDGIVRPDPLKLSLDVTALGALRDSDGLVSSNLFAVGPMTKSAFWEMTAVPDIRRHCEVLATYIGQLLNTTQLSPVSTSRVAAI
jgi:uncharacterized NAD(P)/FAD-binding protein YdhS